MTLIGFILSDVLLVFCVCNLLCIYEVFSYAKIYCLTLGSYFSLSFSNFFSIQNSLKFLFTVTQTNNPYIFITYFKHVFVIVFLDDKLDTRRKIPSHTHTHIRHDKSCCLTFYAYLKITLSKEIS